jgi:hypothetical protein
MFTSLRNLCDLCVSAVNKQNPSYRRAAEGAEVAQRKSIEVMWSIIHQR